MEKHPDGGVTSRREKRAEETQIQMTPIEAAREQAKIVAEKKSHLRVKTEGPARSSQHQSCVHSTTSKQRCQVPEVTFTDDKDELDSYLVRFEC